LIYVVLGMHKSGTTLVSQILHRSGINMGDNIDTGASYDQWGPEQKHERASTLLLNREILGLGDDGRFMHLEAPDTLQVTENQRARMQEIIQECNTAYADWGFKDPRTALTYPMWASQLPEHKIITIYRSPGEIWPRFRGGRLNLYGNLSRACRLLKRWCEHNSRILTYLQNTKSDFLVLSYQELMTTNAEFNRLQEFVGRRLSDQRKESLYRSRREAYPLIAIATWLVRRQTGCTPRKIIEQLEALRQGR